MAQDPRFDRGTSSTEPLREPTRNALLRYRRPLWGVAWLAAALAFVIWAWSLPRGGGPPPPQAGVAALTMMGLILFFPWRGTLSAMSILGRLFLAAAEGIHMLGDIARVPGLQVLAQVHLPAGAAVLCLLAALFCFGAPRLGSKGLPRRRWRLKYIGVWPLITTGDMVELSVGRDVQVSWRDQTITFPVEEVASVQLDDTTPRNGWVGWWHNDLNSGQNYWVSFETQSNTEARTIAQALAMAGHRATEAEWAEWRTLAVTVLVPATTLRDGGTYEAQIERRLACPECTAQKVGNPGCEFCHGSRFVKERDTLVLTIPAGSQPGKSLVVPGQGNRDANGVRGPLVVTLRGDSARRS
jgi:hypothetical protein